MQGVPCVSANPVLWVSGVQRFFLHFLFWECRAADKTLSSLLGRSLMSAAFCSIKYSSRWTSSLQFSRGSQVVSPSSHLRVLGPCMSKYFTNLCFMVWIFSKIVGDVYFPTREGHAVIWL